MKFENCYILYIYVRHNTEDKMTLLAAYDINAMATNISREFYINEVPEDDKSYILEDEMNLFAENIKSKLSFLSKAK